MSLIPYIENGEAVDDIVSNRALKDVITQSGLDPDVDFIGFLSQILLQENGIAVGTGVKTLNFLNAVLTDNGSVVDIFVGSPPSFPVDPIQYVTADAGLSGLVNGDPVSTWTDQSPSGNDLTAAGTARPTYIADADGDGVPCVRFDGGLTGFKFTPSAALVGKDITVMLVARHAVESGLRGINAFYKTGQTGSGNNSFGIDQNSGRLIMTGGSNRGLSNPNTGYQEWLWSVYIFRYVELVYPPNALSNPTQHKMMICNSGQTQLESDQSNDLEIDYWTLGCQADAAGAIGNNLRCDVRAFAVWDAALSDTQAKEVASSMAAKWNIFI